MKNYILEVAGMTCQHCAAHVKEEIGALDGVTEVSVQLVAGGASTVHLSANADISDAALREALDEAGGYELISVRR